jgi:hypothetical protein
LHASANLDIIISIIALCSHKKSLGSSKSNPRTATMKFQAIHLLTATAKVVAAGSQVEEDMFSCFIHVHGSGFQWLGYV